jgi:hypothetical protein
MRATFKVRQDSVVGRLARAARYCSPGLRITVSPFWARVLVAGGAHPVPSADAEAIMFPASSQQAPELSPRAAGESVPGTGGGQPQAPAPERSEVLRLPRLDRTALKTAGTTSLYRQSLETRHGTMRYVQRDAGRSRLEITADSASDSVSNAVLAVTVTTPQRSTDYFLLFMAEESGRWAADVQVPAFHDWPEITVRGLRTVSSLDRADAEVVARSVRAAPDPWVPAWQAVAQAREAGDPVREAIENSLRS